MPDLQYYLPRLRVAAQSLVCPSELVHTHVMPKSVPVGPVKSGALPNILVQPTVPRLQEGQIVAARHYPDDLGNCKGDVQRRLTGSNPSLSRVVDGGGRMEDLTGCTAPARLDEDTIAHPERLHNLLPDEICRLSLKQPKHEKSPAEVSGY